MPLPLFFAEDKLSFYKVMSDTQGYKHIHYVKDVSIFMATKRQTASVITHLLLYVIFAKFILLRAKRRLSPRGSGKSSTYPD